jgi:hypothetical protein
MKSAEVRQQLVEALRLDLIGPDPVRNLGAPDEALPQSPSRWYLGGFLVPLDAAEEQRSEEGSDDDLNVMSEAGGTDDATTPEPAAARRAYMPSSIGLSVLVSAATRQLQVTVRWGDYRLHAVGEGQGGSVQWKRTRHEEQMALALPERTTLPDEKDVPSSAGLKVALMVRLVQSDGAEGGLPQGTRSVSVFLVNRRRPAPDETRDEAFAFQAQLEIASQEPLVPRPDLRSLQSEDWDDRVADLQYRDAFEYAVGHSVAAEAVKCDDRCQVVRTCWIPGAEVERVAPARITGVALSMEALADLAGPDDAKAKLGGFVAQYRQWIAAQQATMPQSPERRRATAEELLRLAGIAADRIERGIALLADPQCLDAFKIANRTMAKAAKQRQSVVLGPLSVAADEPQRTMDNGPRTPPTWRPFQLAFILMNLPGIAGPVEADREVVDLLFFPTGGGKTEAYLGLAAFTLVLRRLKNPGIASAGLAVLMRYTLRLLTLDQLSRAATLICALELERQQDVGKLGEWPFEIGLWVGKAATPNVMGKVNDGNSESARASRCPAAGCCRRTW